ncbi:MAG: DUF1801 domain-containing protein [Bacteroidia bacterium]|nr:DUF1801 domain-containing protein [Bacteroidia bacterium]
MADQKTKETNENVRAFINAFADTEQKKEDSFALIKLMQNITGFEPKMWGPSIIGFGTYHYKYDSGHEGDAPLIGFSPRKTAFSLYVYSGLEEHEYLLQNLGKFKMGKACMYVKKLSDINLPELEIIIKETINFLKLKYAKH